MTHKEKKNKPENFTSKGIDAGYEQKSGMLISLIEIAFLVPCVFIVTYKIHICLSGIGLFH